MAGRASGCTAAKATTPAAARERPLRARDLMEAAEAVAAEARALETDTRGGPAYVMPCISKCGFPPLGHEGVVKTTGMELILVCVVGSPRQSIHATPAAKTTQLWPEKQTCIRKRTHAEAKERAVKERAARRAALTNMVWLGVENLLCCVERGVGISWIGWLNKYDRLRPWCVLPYRDKPSHGNHRTNRDPSKRTCLASLHACLGWLAGWTSAAAAADPHQSIMGEGYSS